jgi:hypothetical protein
MNCEIFERRLLGTERPDHPPGEVKEHLVRCATCRATQRRLIQAEREIRLLSVPPSTARASLIQQILTASSPGIEQPSGVRGQGSDPDTNPKRQRGDDNTNPKRQRGTDCKSVLQRQRGDPGPQPTRWWQRRQHENNRRPAPQPGRREGARQKLALAFAMAAALAVFAIGWWAWPHHSPAPPPPVTPDPLAPYLAQRDRKLEKAHTAKERVEVLVAYAEELLQEAGKLTGNSERLALLARFYGELVRKDLIQQARAIPVADRAAFLPPLARRLVKAESAASRLAAQLDRNNAASARSLRTIATAARESGSHLDALARGDLV